MSDHKYYNFLGIFKQVMIQIHNGVPADGLALLGARASTGTRMPKFVSYTEKDSPILEGSTQLFITRSSYVFMYGARQHSTISTMAAIRFMPTGYQCVKWLSTDDSSFHVYCNTIGHWLAQVINTFHNIMVKIFYFPFSKGSHEKLIDVFIHLSCLIYT